MPWHDAAPLHVPKMQDAPGSAPRVGLRLDEHTRANDVQIRTGDDALFDATARGFDRTACDPEAAVADVDGDDHTGEPEVVAALGGDARTSEAKRHARREDRKHATAERDHAMASCRRCRDR